MSGNIRRLLMIGAGHGHLHLAQHAMQLVEAGLTPTLIDPGRFWYSGMATGMLSGHYEPEQDIVEPAPLIEAHGGHFVCDRAVAIDRTQRMVRLASGHSLHYDWLSLNVGSEVAVDQTVIGLENAWTVKPIANLWRLRSRLEAWFAERPETPARVVVVGGGATGCEVALNLDALARRHGGRLQLTLISRSRLMKGYPQAAAHRVMQLMRARSLHVLNGCSVARIQQDRVHCDDGQTIAWDNLVLATGLRPPRWLTETGLTISEDGSLVVDDCLRSVDDEHIFGIGDCIRMGNHPLPRIGVYGVRQAPVLLQNLCAAAQEQPLHPYRPQRRYLSILNTGDGKALAVRGRHHWYGRTSLWLKDWIDRRFVEGFRV